MTPDDRALLIRLDERTLKMIKVLEDNGQPGLVTRTSRCEEGLKTLQSNFKLLAWLLGIVIAAAGVVVAAVKH